MFLLLPKKNVSTLLVAVVEAVCLLSAFVTKSASPDWIDTVHVVFMNHLDVGFNADDSQLGFSRNVVNHYFDVYFPKAVDVGDNMTQIENKTFTWTTHSWLISLYFDCPPDMLLHCPNDSSLARIKYGIDQGYIRWHAFPFNSQLELYDKSMVQFGVRLSHDLSDNFGTPRSSVISQRDVPGMTRSMIPVLLESNVSAITIGCNGGSAPPDVPNIFMWRDECTNGCSNESMVTMVHPGGYGGTALQDAVYLQNWNEALIFAFKGDNEGPQSVDEALAVYAQLDGEFPAAAKLGSGTKNGDGKGIFASTYTNFADALLAQKDVVAELPIYTQEIDDTWVHGPASDPWKMAAARVMQRKRTECLESQKCSLDSYPFYNFSRLLLKNGEHTFGGDIKHFLNSYTNGSLYYYWSNSEFEEGLSSNESNNGMTRLRSTWYEQRDWGLEYAMQALSYSNNSADQSLFKSIDSEIMSVLYAPKSPVAGGAASNYTSRNNTFIGSKVFNIADRIEIGFDNVTGGINRLVDMERNISYASGAYQIGTLLYQTFTETTFNDFIGNYSYDPGETFVLYDFGKHLLDEYCTYCIRQDVSSVMTGFYEAKKNIYGNGTNSAQAAQSAQFVVEMQIGTQDQQKGLKTNYGVPESIFNKVEIGINNDNGIYVDLQVTWINKTSTRIPETLWVKMNPQDCTQYAVQKLDEMVDVGPGYVIYNGSYHLHATTGNVSCAISTGARERILVEPIDTALIGFVPQGENDLTPFPVPFRNITDGGKNGGFGFVLYDNIWGTNYPMWYPFDDSNSNHTFRFKIYL